LDLRKFLDSEALAWQDAACLDHPKLKWVGDLKQEDYAPNSIVKMLEICSTCPVRRECLMRALESRFETLGVWGGTTTIERRRALSARGGHDAPDLYGNKADTEDAMRMHIRERRAREVAQEFEQDLPPRLRRWRKKAAKFERDLRGKCSDCDGQMEWKMNHSTCTGCGLKRWPSGKVERVEV
jgi:hypothetical protein